MDAITPCMSQSILQLSLQMTVIKLRVNGWFKQREGSERESTARRQRPSFVYSLTESRLNQIAEQASMATQARNCFGCNAVKESFNVPGFLLLLV